MIWRSGLDPWFTSLMAPDAGGGDGGGGAGSDSSGGGSGAEPSYDAASDDPTAPDEGSVAGKPSGGGRASGAPRAPQQRQAAQPGEDFGWLNPHMERWGGREKMESMFREAHLIDQAMRNNPEFNQAVMAVLNGQQMPRPQNPEQAQAQQQVQQAAGVLSKYKGFGEYNGFDHYGSVKFWEEVGQTGPSDFFMNGLATPQVKEALYELMGQHPDFQQFRNNIQQMQGSQWRQEWGPKFQQLPPEFQQLLNGNLSHERLIDGLLGIMQRNQQSQAAAQGVQQQQQARQQRNRTQAPRGGGGGSRKGGLSLNATNAERMAHYRDKL